MLKSWKLKKKQKIWPNILWQNVFIVCTRLLVIKHSASVRVQTLKPIFAKFCSKFLALSSFFHFFSTKSQKSLFQPAIGVHSTQFLVKIYNTLVQSDKLFPIYYLNLSLTFFLKLRKEIYVHWNKDGTARAVVSQMWVRLSLNYSGDPYYWLARYLNGRK